MASDQSIAIANRSSKPGGSSKGCADSRLGLAMPDSGTEARSGRSRQDSFESPQICFPSGIDDYASQRIATL
jgi:hypothetical protein